MSCQTIVATVLSLDAGLPCALRETRPRISVEGAELPRQQTDQSYLEDTAREFRTMGLVPADRRCEAVLFIDVMVSAVDRNYLSTSWCSTQSTSRWCAAAVDYFCGTAAVARCFSTLFALKASRSANNGCHRDLRARYAVRISRTLSTAMIYIRTAVAEGSVARVQETR